MEKIYYEINEEMARQAKAMHSMDISCAEAL